MWRRGEGEERERQQGDPKIPNVLKNVLAAIFKILKRIGMKFML